MLIHEIAAHSEELIALRNSDQFVVLPLWLHRVSTIGNAGLTLHAVTAADAGKYKVDVTSIDQNGIYHHLTRTVTVTVVN